MAEREADAHDTSMHVDAPQRPVRVEALAEVAQAALAATGEPGLERARLVVHVDAAALASDGDGRSELEDGPVIAPETARRFGCDADVVAQVERDANR